VHERRSIDVHRHGGQLRRCHELARQFPCSQPNSPISPAALSPTEPDPIFADCLSLDGCSPFVAATGYTYVSPECPRVGLASLQAFDGVYEVEGFPISWPDPSCAPLPEPFESTRYFALVSTEVSGAAEVILQNCDAVADCQALARAIQAPGSALVVEALAAHNRLLACDAPNAVALQSIVPDVPSCQLMSEPAVAVLGDPSLLRLLLSGRTDTEVSPGCGYIIPPDPAESGSCPSLLQLRAMPVAPL
jgi:hypothetical protein